MAKMRRYFLTNVNMFVTAEKEAGRIGKESAEVIIARATSKSDGGNTIIQETESLHIFGDAAVIKRFNGELDYNAGHQRVMRERNNIALTV